MENSQEKSSNVSETQSSDEKRNSLSDQILEKIKGAKTENDQKQLAAELAGQINDYRKIARINEKTSQVWRKNAHVDILTGLDNRRKAESDLEKEMARAKKYSYPLSILIGDLDGLKGFNDESEDHHSLGDQALKAAGNAIQKGIRETDFAARWGGDEFLVILPFSDKEDAVVVAKRILDKVEETPSISGKKLSISIGIGQWQPEEKLEELFTKADGAAYQAKESKDKIVIAVS